MRVLHIISSVNLGGAEGVLYGLLAGGLAESHDTAVVSIAGPGHYGPRLEALGVPVHYLDMPGRRVNLGALRQLRRITRDFSPDVIQGWMYHGNLAAALTAGLGPRRAAIAWNIRHGLYDLANEKARTRWVIRAGRLMSRRADGIVYNSHLSRQQHEAYGYAASNGTVIPNGFDTDAWQPDPAAHGRLRSMLGLGDADKVVGFVARYHPIKDIPTFLKALSPVMVADPSVACVIVGRGTGADNPDLAAHYAALPGERMHLLGERGDLRELMPGFDVFVLSSLSEGFSNVLGEAMASGVPCVSTDVGDSAHIIAETGLVVPPGDPAKLSEAMAWMLDMPAEERRARGRAARQRVEEHFSRPATVERYASLYQALAGRRDVRSDHADLGG